MEKWQLLKNGEIKREYTDAAKALQQYEICKELRPDEKWDLRKKEEATVRGAPGWRAPHIFPLEIYSRALYNIRGVIVWLRGCGSPRPEIKEGNPSGLPSLSYYCQSVNHARQTHAGRGFEYVQRMSVQTNLYTRGVHKIRTPLQAQRYAHHKRRHRSLYHPPAVFPVTGNAAIFNTFHDSLYHFVFLLSGGGIIPQNINSSL